jgi:hypothetical protein
MSSSVATFDMLVSKIDQLVSFPRFRNVVPAAVQLLRDEGASCPSVPIS